MEIPNFPVTFGDTVAITICTSGRGATEAQIFFANITANQERRSSWMRDCFLTAPRSAFSVILPNGLLSVPRSAKTLPSSLTMPKYFSQDAKQFHFRLTALAVM